MYRRLAALKRRRNGGDRGFTLIELLVVITILGILAAIVVFAVNGIGDKGLQSSIATDAATVRTAEEADCAQNGHFDTTANLVPGLLANSPTYNGVVFYPAGSSGGACSLPGTTPPANAYTVGSSSFASTATNVPNFLAASNNQPGFSFLDSSFIAANSANVFTFDKSSALKTTATGTANAGNTAIDGTIGGAPPLDSLFASADETNVDGTIPNAGVTTQPAVSATNFQLGTCATSSSVKSCPGIGSTKTEYTVGNLVGFSCATGGQTLAPASGAPTCKIGGNGVQAALTNVADLATRLLGNAALKVAIADPFPVVCSDAVTATDGTGTPKTTTVAPTAPYGIAAMQALTSTTTNGGGGLSCADFNVLVKGTGTLSNGRVETQSQIVTGDQTQAGPAGNNVTVTQTQVVTGLTDFALIPKSFVVSPTGNDTDPFFTVPAAAETPIRQWAVVLNDGSTADENLAQSFLNYVVSSQGQAVLAAYGYSPIS